MEDKSEILIYEAADGHQAVEVKLEAETVWLSLQQIADLFGRDKSVISRHLRNVFRSGELDKDSVVAKNATTAADGKTYQVEFYNLDAIISVGYRVNSKEGTQFRIWATEVLRNHLVEGYTINEKRLKAAENKYMEMLGALKLMENLLELDHISGETRGLISIITEYSRALDILDDYDHERLGLPEGTQEAKFKLTYEEARKIIEVMKEKFSDSALVGREKDQSFIGSIGAIYQTFEEKEVYPSIEEKAAHLLYFVTKNHSFVDGNKRIAAALFVCFLEKNGILYYKKGIPRIDNSALVALTLMIAVSKPEEKETMVKVILNLLG